ncbi:MAG: hypothetical protein WAO76_07370 [Georgfuchsia sp.]
MSMTHEEVKLICEAKKLASDHGMFVVQKPGKYLLYRKRPHRNIPLGHRSDLHNFLGFVKRVIGMGKPA